MEEEHSIIKAQLEKLREAEKNRSIVSDLFKTNSDIPAMSALEASLNEQAGAMVSTKATLASAQMKRAQVEGKEQRAGSTPDSSKLLLANKHLSSRS